jgi:hypothetical protein
MSNKKLVSVILTASICIGSLACAAAFTACGNGAETGGDKNSSAKVKLLGMSATQNEPSSSSVSANDGGLVQLSATSSGDNLTANRTVSNMADYAASSTTSFARNEAFYLCLHLDNPNEYDIINFTISYDNDSKSKKFASYNFEKFSTYGEIYVSLTAIGEDIGEYTVTQITYLEGTEIKQSNKKQASLDNATLSILLSDIRGGDEISNSEYTLNSDGQSYTLNYLNDASGDVLTIPSSYEGLPVTKIADKAFAYTTAKKVIIPDSITEIGAKAFYNAIDLEEVILGNGISFIGKYCFYGCSQLNYVNYTGDLASWCKIQFGTKKDEQLYNMQTNDNYADTTNRYANPTYYAHDLHIGGKLVTEVVVPDEITAILYGAFERCQSITKLQLHENVKYIGYNAFLTCAALGDVDLGGVEIIDASAFNGCYALTSITLPETVKKINGYNTSSSKNAAFWADTKLLEVYNYSSNLADLFVGSTNYGCVAYSAKMVYNKTKPNEDESNLITDTNGFVWYTNTGDERSIYLVGYVGDQSEITIPYKYGEKTVILYECAFAGNTIVKKVTLEEGFASIPARLFAYCSTIEEVIVPATVTSIGLNAFWSSGLQRITLPENCKTFAKCFNDCGTLEITINCTSPNFTGPAFYGTENVILHFNGTLAEWCKYMYTSDFTNVLYKTSSYIVYCTDATITQDGIQLND